MPVAIDTEETFDYVLKCDSELPEDDPGRTVFHLGTLSARKYAQLQDGSISWVGTEEREARVKSGTTELAVLMEGVKGWSNLKKSNGEEVIYKYASLEKLLSHLKPSHRTELAEVILNGSELSEEDEKNLE
jgi:hypothetical protein